MKSTSTLPARSKMSMAFEEGSDLVINETDEYNVQNHKWSDNLVVPSMTALKMIGRAKIIKDLDTGVCYTIEEAMNRSILDPKRKCLLSKTKEDVYLTQNSSGIDQVIAILLSQKDGFYSQTQRRPISILEAIDAGLLVLEKGGMMAKHGKRVVSIAEAHTLQMIDDRGVELLNELANEISRFTKTSETRRQSITTIPITQVGNRKELDEDFIPGVRSTANLTLSDALLLNLIDKTQNQYIRHYDGQRISIREAVHSGFLSGNVPEIIWRNSKLTLNEAMDRGILNGETGYIRISDTEQVTILTASVKGYLEKPMTIGDLLINDLIDQSRYPSSIFNRRTNKWTTFEMAIQNLLLDKDYRSIVHPKTLKTLSLDEAIRSGLLLMNGNVMVVGYDQPMELLEAVKEGHLGLIVRRPMLKGGFIVDVMGKRLVSVGEAINRSILNVSAGTVMNTSTKESYSLSEAAKIELLAEELYVSLYESSVRIDGSEDKCLMDLMRKGVVDFGNDIVRVGSDKRMIRDAISSGIIDWKSGGELIDEVRGDVGYGDYLLLYNGESGHATKSSDFTLKKYSVGMAIPCKQTVSEIGMLEERQRRELRSFVHREFPRVGAAIMHEQDNIHESAKPTGGSKSSFQPMQLYAMPADVAGAVGSASADMATAEAGETIVACDSRSNVTKCTHIDGIRGGIRRSVGSGACSSREGAIPTADVRRQLSFIEAVNEQLLNIKTGYVNIPISHSELPDSHSTAADYKLSVPCASTTSASGSPGGSPCGQRLIDLREAIESGIINPDSAYIVDPSTKESLNLLEAIDRNIISISGSGCNTDSRVVPQPSITSETSINTHYRRLSPVKSQQSYEKHPVADSPLAKQGPSYTISQAIKAGILKIGNPKLHSSAGDSMISKTESFSVKSVRDARTNQFISPNKAIKLRILDPYQGAYYDTCTNRKYTIDEAISQGDILVEKIFDSSLPKSRGDQFSASYNSSDQKSERNVINTSLIREIRSYHLLGVIDPLTRSDMSVHEAINSGILDRKKGRLYNGQTHEWLSISDAINQGFIQARIMPIDDNVDPRLLLSRRAVSETKTFALKGAMDTRTDKIISIRQAIETGIIDQATGLYRNLATGETMPISLAVENGLIITEESGMYPSRRIEHGPTFVTKDTKLLCIEAVIDPVSRSRITVNEAFKRGLIDSVNCSFFNSLTNKIISLTDAYVLGYIIGHYVSDEASHHGIGGGLYARVIREERSYLITSVLDTRSDRKINLSDAIDKGLFDREKAVYVNPLTNQETNLKDAIAQGFVEATVVTGAPDKRSPCSTKVIRIQESDGVTIDHTLNQSGSTNRAFKVDTVEEYIEPITNTGSEDRYHKVVHKERNIRERDVFIETSYGEDDLGLSSATHRYQSGMRPRDNMPLKEIIIDDHKVAEPIDIESETRSIALKQVTIEDDQFHRPSGKVVVIEEQHRIPYSEPVGVTSTSVSSTTQTSQYINKVVEKSRDEVNEEDIRRYGPVKPRPKVMLSVDETVAMDENEKEAQRKEREIFISEILTKAKEYKDTSDNTTHDETRITETMTTTTDFSVVHDGLRYTLTWVLNPKTNEKISLKDSMDLGLFDSKSMAYFHSIESKHYTLYEAIRRGFIGTNEDIRPIVVTFDNIEYTINWVLDPSEKSKIFPQRAVQKGILDVESKRYLNPYNNISINLHEAVKMKFIGATEKLPESDEISVIVGEHTVRFNWVVDTINRDRIGAYDALKRGIVDIQKGIYFKFDTGDIMTLFDAYNAGFIGLAEDRLTRMASPLAGSIASLDEDELTITTRTATYVITSVVHPVQQQEIKVSDAIDLGIIDKTTGSYRDMTTGVTYELADAINEGLVYASVIETKESTEMETSSVKNVIERFIVKTVIDPRDGKRIGGLQAQAGGILNYAQGMYSDPDSGRCISIREAIDRDLIEVELIKQTSDEQFRLDICTDSFTLRRVTIYTIHSVKDPVLDEDISAQEAVHRQIIDSDTKKYFNASNGQYIELKDAMNLGLIRADVKENIMRKPLRLSLQNAFRLGFYNYSTGIFRDPYSEQTMTLQEAIDKGHIHLSSPAFASSIQGPISLRDALNMGLISRSNGKLDQSKVSQYQVVISDAKIYRMNFEDAVRCGLLDLSTGFYKHLHTGEKLTIKEAIGRGLLDGESTTVQSPITFEYKSLAEAISSGDLDDLGNVIDCATGEFISSIEKEFNQRRIFSNFDVNSGEVFIRPSGERLSFEKAVRKSKLDSHFRIIDFKSGREFSIQEALEHGIIDSENGRVYNYVDGNNMSIREAVRRGFVAVSDSTVVPMKADQGALAVRITSKKRRRSSRTRSGGALSHSTNLSIDGGSGVGSSSLYRTSLLGDTMSDAGHHKSISSSTEVPQIRRNLYIGCGETTPLSYKTQYLPSDANIFSSVIIQSVFDPITCGRVSAQNAVDNGSLDPLTGAFIDQRHEKRTMLPFEEACSLGLIDPFTPDARNRTKIISVLNDLNEFIDLRSAIQLGIIDYLSGTYKLTNTSHLTLTIHDAIDADYIVTSDEECVGQVGKIETVTFKNLKLKDITTVMSDNQELSVEEAIAKEIIDDQRGLYNVDQQNCKLSFHTACKNGLVKTATEKLNQKFKSFSLTKSQPLSETPGRKSSDCEKSSKSNLFKKIREKLLKRGRSSDAEKLEDHLFTRLPNGSIVPMIDYIDPNDQQFRAPSVSELMSVEKAIHRDHIFAFNQKLNRREGLKMDPVTKSITLLKFTANCRKRNVLWIAKCNRILLDGMPISVEDAVSNHLVNVLTFELSDWMREPAQSQEVELDDQSLSEYISFRNMAISQNTSLVKAYEDNCIDMELKVVLNTLSNKWLSISEGIGEVLITVNQSVTISEVNPKEFIIIDNEKRIKFTENDLFDKLQSLVSDSTKTVSYEQITDGSEDPSPRCRVTSLSEIINDIVATSAKIVSTHGGGDSELPHMDAQTFADFEDGDSRVSEDSDQPNSVKDEVIEETFDLNTFDCCELVVNQFENEEKVHEQWEASESSSCELIEDVVPEKSTSEMYKSPEIEENQQIDQSDNSNSSREYASVDSEEPEISNSDKGLNRAQSYEAKQLKSSAIEQGYANLDEMLNNLKNIEDDLLAVYERATQFATHAGDFSEAAVQIVPQTQLLRETHLEMKNKLDSRIHNLNDLSSLLLTVNEKHNQLVKHADDLSSSFNHIYNRVRIWRDANRLSRKKLLLLKRHFLSHSKCLEDIRLSAGALVELLLANPQIFGSDQAEELHRVISSLVKDFEKAVELMQSINWEDEEMDINPESGDELINEVPVERNFEKSVDMIAEFAKLADVLKTSISVIEDIIDDSNRAEEKKELMVIIHDIITREDNIDHDETIRDHCSKLGIEEYTINDLISGIENIRKNIQKHLSLHKRFEELVKVIEDDLDCLMDFLDNQPAKCHTIIDCENEVGIAQEKRVFHTSIGLKIEQLHGIIETITECKAIRSSQKADLCDVITSDDSSIGDIDGDDFNHSTVYNDLKKRHDNLVLRLNNRDDELENFLQKLHSYTCSSHAAWKLLSECQTSIDSLDLLDGVPLSLVVLSNIEDELTTLRRRTIDDGYIIDGYRTQFDNLYTSNDLSSQAIEEEKRIDQLLQKWSDVCNYLEEGIIEIRDQMLLVQTMDEVFETVSDDMANRGNLLKMLTLSSSDSSVLACSLQSAFDMQNDHNDRYCLVTHIYSLLERIRSRAEKDADDSGLKEKCEKLNNEWLDLGTRIIDAIEQIKKTQEVIDQFDEQFKGLNVILDGIDEKLKHFMDSSDSTQTFENNLVNKAIDESEGLIWKCREIAAKAADIPDSANLSEEIESTISIAIQRLDQYKLMVASIVQSIRTVELASLNVKPDLLLALDRIIPDIQPNDSSFCKETALVLKKTHPDAIDELVNWPMRHDHLEQEGALQLLFNLAKAIIKQQKLIDSLVEITSRLNRNDDEESRMTELKNLINNGRLHKTGDVLTVIHRATLSKIDLIDRINGLELSCQLALITCEPESEIVLDMEKGDRVLLSDLKEIHSCPERLSQLLDKCQHLMHRFRSDFRSYECILNNHIMVSILSTCSDNLSADLSLYISEFQELERDCLRKISDNHEMTISKNHFESIADSKTLYIRKLLGDVHSCITEESTCTDLMGLLKNVERILASIEYTTNAVVFGSGSKEIEDNLMELNREAEWCKEFINKRLSPHQMKRIENASNLLDEASFFYSEALTILDKYEQINSIVKPKHLQFQIEELSSALANVQKSESIIKRIRNEMEALEPVVVESDRVDEIIMRIGELENDERTVATRLTTRITFLTNSIHPSAQAFWKDLCTLREDLDSTQNALYEIFQSAKPVQSKGSNPIDELSTKQQAISKLAARIKDMKSMIDFKSTHQLIINVVTGASIDGGICNKSECLDEIKGLTDEVNERYSGLLNEALQCSDIVSTCLEEVRTIYEDIQENTSSLAILKSKFDGIQADILLDDKNCLIRDLNECYDWVDATTTRCNIIKNLGNKLAEIADDSMYRDLIVSINEAFRKLELECEDLTAISVDRATSIENKLINLNCEDLLVDNLSNWLNEMIARVASISENDNQTIPMACSGIETRKGCYDIVQKLGGRELETLWLNLNNEVGEQELNIKELKQPDESLTRLFAWIKTIEANFTLRSRDLPLAGSHKVLQKQYNKFMVTFNDILAHEEEVNRRINEQSDRLSCESFSDRAKYDQRRLSLIRNKWTLLKDRAIKRKEKFENALKDAFNFSEDLQSLNDSLGGLETQLNQIGFSNRNRESLLHQQSLHDEFLKDVSNVRIKLIAGEKLGTKIRFYCRPSDAIMVRNLLFAMKRRYDKIMSRSSEKRRAIDRLLKEINRFHSLYDQLNEWVLNVIEVLEAEENTSYEADHGVEGKDYQRTLDEHKLLMREIEVNRTVFDQLLRQCNRWISTSNSNEEKSRLRGLCTRLKTNWQNLALISSKRRQDIETSMLIQGRIEDLSANIIHWLSDINTSLAPQSFCCYGDILTVSALCEAHDALIADVDSAAEQIDMLIDLKEHQPHLSNEKRIILFDLNASVKNRIERRSTILGHALSTAIQFDEEIKKFLHWANEMESSLRSLRRLPATEEELQFVTEQLGDSLKQISNHQEDFNQIKDMSGVILHACHPDAIQSIKECVNLTEIRLKEIVGYACELEEKLNMVLKNKLAYDKTMIELETWLKKIEDYFEGIDVLVKEKLNPEVVEDRLEQAELVSQDLKVICGRLETSFSTFSVGHSMAPMIARSGTLFNLLKSSTRKTSSPDPILGKFDDSRTHTLLIRIRETVQRSSQYISKLQDWLAFKCGKQELKNFDFERWIRRNGPAIKYCRNRLLQYFRRRDENLSDRVDVEDFIIGLTSVAKLNTGRAQIILVAELFKDDDHIGGRTVKFKEFLNAVIALIEQNRRGRRTSGNSEIAGIGGDRIRNEMCNEIGMCSCSEKFRMQPVSEGKYSFGANKRVHLVRILRSTVMVRVGGGWVSLAEFLAKNDPCRAKGRTNQELREEFLSNSGIEPCDVHTRTPIPTSPKLLKTALWNAEGHRTSRCAIHNIDRQHRQSCEFPSISGGNSTDKVGKRRARSGGSSVYRSRDEISDKTIHL